MKEYRMKCTRCGQINSAEDMKIDYVDGGYYGEPHGIPAYSIKEVRA